MTALSLAETALSLGLSPRRFRAVWRDYVTRLAFPAPFRSPPASNFAWDSVEVETWKAGRARCGLAATPAANDSNPLIHPLDHTTPSSAVVHNPRLERERAQLRRMMQGA